MGAPIVMPAKLIELNYDFFSAADKLNLIFVSVKLFFIEGWPEKSNSIYQQRKKNRNSIHLSSLLGIAYPSFGAIH